eukprot:scaffold5831_cov77-Cylindrotheca_fusiformis.AAC.2
MQMIRGLLIGKSLFPLMIFQGCPMSWLVHHLHAMQCNAMLFGSIEMEIEYYTFGHATSLPVCADYTLLDISTSEWILALAIVAMALILQLHWEWGMRIDIQAL